MGRKVEVDQVTVVWCGVHCGRKGIEIGDAEWVLDTPDVITEAVLLIKSRAHPDFIYHLPRGSWLGMPVFYDILVSFQASNMK